MLQIVFEHCYQSPTTISSFRQVQTSILPSDCFQHLLPLFTSHVLRVHFQPSPARSRLVQSGPVQAEFTHKHDPAVSICHLQQYTLAMLQLISPLPDLCSPPVPNLNMVLACDPFLMFFASFSLSLLTSHSNFLSLVQLMQCGIAEESP